MKDFEYGITISGTHGKSTTAAMIANILIDAGLDPTVIIGSIASEFNSNARHGGRKFFVVEACEHFAHMLKLHPRLIVLTNIEEDHLDYYRDLEHIVMTFQKYINGLPVNGVLVKNSDDSESKELGFDGQIITYGIDQIADQQATNIRYDHLQQYFCSGGVDFHLNIPGKFNVYNALAAITVARHLHIAEEVIQKTLANFRGVWRRFQILGEYRGATVISDYAHHPTAVRSTISAAKDFYPKRRLITVFQPHQHSRTKKLFKKFVESFAAADFVILQEIFDVVGREAENDQNISSRDLVKVIEQRGKYAFFANSPVETRRAIDELLEPNDVLLIMGAGDIYQLAENLFNGNV